MTVSPLERRYRLLLRAYPGRYRRRHGREILTTLLEMAGPGQTRPGLGDTWHLVGSGVRQRFRLPAGRPLAGIGAVLATVILAAFGAAAGSAVAAATFAPLPGDAAVRALLSRAGGDTGTDIVRFRSSWWDEIVMAQADGSASWTAEQSRAAITAAGWHTGAIESDRARPTAGDPVPPARFAYFPAARDGVAVDAEVIQTDGRAAQVQLEVEPAGNGSLLPLIVAGLILGGVAGRLLAAALAQRTRTAPRRRRVTAAGLAGLAVVLLALPAGALFGNVLRAFRYAGDDGPVYTVHSAFTPGPYYPFGPYWLVAALTVAGVLAGAAMIAVAATGPEVQSRTETVRN